MARKLPASRQIERRPAKFKPKLLLVVCCEGKNTEPDYLMEFATAFGNKLVKVEPIRAAGAPLTLVRKAVQLRNALLAKADGAGDSFADDFEVWGVFDIDEHPKVPEAKQLAKANQIQLCISNPCFELWGLLHYRDQDGDIDRHAVQRGLAKHMPGYDYKKGKSFNVADILPRYAEARTRAVRLEKRRNAERTPGGNPSTNIYELLETIIENGATKFQSV